MVVTDFICVISPSYIKHVKVCMTRVTSLPLRHRTNVNKEHLWLTFERSCLIGVSIGHVAPKCKFDFSRSIAEDKLIQLIVVTDRCQNSYSKVLNWFYKVMTNVLKILRLKF